MYFKNTRCFASTTLMFFVVLASGCIPARSTKPFNIVGTWAGTIEWSSNKVLEDRDGLTRGKYDIVFMSCGKNGKVVAKEPSNNTSSVLFLPRLYQSHGNYVFYSVERSPEKDPDWVESQVWSFALESTDTALVYWSRVVSNPKLKVSDHFRTFSQGGTAKLSRISSGCTQQPTPQPGEPHSTDVEFWR